MAPRLRRCVECPRCFTRYLVGFTSYNNGARLVSLVTEFSENYQLFCSCDRQAFPSSWNWRELKTYAIPADAYKRGYGLADEILLCRGRYERSAQY